MGEDRLARAARIKDVARMAGVSTATVSRTLSNPDMVSEETRRTVLDAVKITGYSANVSARNLRRRRTGSVMALAPNLANPFFSEILAGMSDILLQQDLNLIVADTRVGDRGKRRLVDYADRSRADGLLLFDSGLSPHMFAAPQCPPIVQVCEEIDGLDAPRVVADNAGGARAAILHFDALGHEAIGRIRGPAPNSLTRGRDAGFRLGMCEAGLAVRGDWIIEGDFSLASGREAAKRFLAMTDRPTAIFCDNDEIACGLMTGLIAGGLSIPGDIAIIGFDDIELSRHLTPALSTVHQPRRDIGREAARLLLAAIEGEPIPARTTIPVSFRPRQSTGDRP